MSSPHPISDSSSGSESESDVDPEEGVAVVSNIEELATELEASTPLELNTAQEGYASAHTYVCCELGITSTKFL